MAESSGVAQEVRYRLPVQAGEIHQVDGVDSPLSGLALRNEGLRAMERPSHFYLGQARTQASLA